MRRVFPISIGFPGVTGYSSGFVSDLFGEQVFKGFIVGKFDGPLLFGGSLLSSRHSGDPPC
jgi:hypothetical protein